MKTLMTCLLALAALSCNGSEKSAPVVKFDQPAAALRTPMSPDDDCTGCDSTYPTPGGGSAGTILFDQCLFISHYIYTPEAIHHSIYACNSLTVDEMSWVTSNVNWWLTTQQYLASLDYSDVGNYCRLPIDCDPGPYYHLVPFTGGCGQAPNKRVYVTTAVYNALVEAAQTMSCTQCFIRSKCGFTQ